MRPDHTEAAEYYFTYINKVPDGDICAILERQQADTLALLNGVSDEQSLHRYAPDKWSIREVVAHLNDTERVFAFRALWFARGFDSPLPSFDQNVAVPASGADARSWASHVDEFVAVRHATVVLFRNMAPEAWSRRGTASGNPFSVRALAWIAAGHVAHHAGIVRDRYLA
ncbi:MAG TPA: DinB family protein [Vicinamibacterales bacterium]